MPQADGLESLRRRIEGLDDRIVDLLAERFALLHEVAAYKHPRGIPVVMPERIHAVIERAAARGQRHGLDPGMLRDIYRRLVEEACRTEARAMDELPRGMAPAAATHD